MILELLLPTIAYLVAVLLLYLVYNYWRNYTHWSKSGLPYIPFPRDSVFYPVHKVDTIKRFYDELAPHPVGGFYKMSRPYLMIRDPEIIRKILIKDFPYFVNHGMQIFPDLDPVNQHVFNIDDERWKGVRQKMAPIFTPQKLKMMWPLMLECRDALGKYLDQLIETRDQIEIREVMSKFALDVIGTCGFGLECDAIQNEDSELRRVVSGGTATQDSNRPAVRSFLRSTGLPLIRLLRLKRIPETVDDFFLGLVRGAADAPAHETANRTDIVQHLVNAQRQEQQALQSQNKAEPLMTESIVASQAFVLFVAGFDTTSGTLGYCLYELSLHPEIMEKCRNEVKSVLEKNGGTISYDCLKDMTYLQCVIDETLRKYAILGWLDRLCGEDYKIETPSLSYTIKRGTRCLIPAHALHRDPKYFPDPERFDPDRFNEENKHKIVPGTYLPFGDGPRICMGMRFAHMEMKTALAFLITRYDFEPTERTTVPLKFYRKSWLSMPESGIWLRLKRRPAA
ncbi:unnamed protein product [Bemisia tabaci]|uniref:Cytochrome P450 n=3 Tax=Bemisia tabaci TaxID=7038 RepID=A0A9P0APW7_BEMTA|nr:unnamed protein product [Bemisia tabaci]